MYLGHCKSQHEIPICYNLKALGCLGFNKYLLEWNYRVSSEVMKMPLFVNTFLLELTVLIECCSLDGFYKQKCFFLTDSDAGSSRSLLKAMSSLLCIVFKKKLLLNYLFTFLFVVWACMCEHVCAHRCRCVWRQVLFPGHHPPCVWKQGLLLTWNQLVSLAWLASEPQGSKSLGLEFIRLYTHAWLFNSEFSFSCLGTSSIQIELSLPALIFTTRICVVK